MGVRVLIQIKLLRYEINNKNEKKIENIHTININSIL